MRVGGARSAHTTRVGAADAEWLARVRRALATGRFVVHYQPIVAVSDGRVAHREALVRLADGAHGELVAPARFLPAAERWGVVREIDRAVLDRALADVRALSERAPRLRTRIRAGARSTPVAVNLSALTLTDPSMLGYVQARLREHGVEGSSLVLEVTETAAIADMAAARAFCAGARALGCAIALDDFGSGFGSLEYLRELPFTHLKIDGRFIRRLARSRNDRRVVGALVALARALGAQTIAEYVGDLQTLELLGDLGVDFAQGYALGRPQPLCAGEASGGEREIRVRAPLWERGARAPG